MAEDKRKKWNQWAEVLWNIILIVGCMYFFCRLLADMNESGFARMAAENRILLPVLGVFLLNMAASTWKNIQKPGACDEQGGSAPEKEAGGKAAIPVHGYVQACRPAPFPCLRKGNQSYVSGSISDYFPGVRYICQRAGAFFTLALEGPAEESAGGAA